MNTKLFISLIAASFLSINAEESINQSGVNQTEQFNDLPDNIEEKKEIKPKNQSAKFLNEIILGLVSLGFLAGFSSHDYILKTISSSDKQKKYVLQLLLDAENHPAALISSLSSALNDKEKVILEKCLLCMHTINLFSLFSTNRNPMSVRRELDHKLKEIFRLVERRLYLLKSIAPHKNIIQTHFSENNCNDHSNLTSKCSLLDAQTFISEYISNQKRIVKKTPWSDRLFKEQYLLAFAELTQNLLQEAFSEITDEELSYIEENKSVNSE